MKNKFDFLTRELYMHLGIIAAVAIIGLILFSSWLSSYTSHGEKIKVPNFSNISFEAAQALAEENNLELKIIDTLYVEDIKPGAIIDHTPKANSFVKENRTIFVSINSSTPILINMPKATEVSLRQATQILESNGLRLGNISYRPDFADNYVFEQLYKHRSIRKGTKIPKGTKIDLVVGKGGISQPVTLPDVMGLTLETAESTLSSLGLNVNIIFDQSTYENSLDSLQAVVWKQSPIFEEGKTIMMGESIDIWVKKEQTEVSE